MAAEVKTTAVFGHHGVTGMCAVNHVVKVYNLGIEHVFLKLNAPMVQIRKIEFVILTNVQASINHHTS